MKVEIPADDSDKEEKDLPSSFVSKIKIYTANSFCHLLEHLNIFFLRILFTQERRYENKSGCFVTGFDVTSKVPTILLTLFFVFVKYYLPVDLIRDYVENFENQWCELKDPRKLLQIHCKN